jgi:hypothetical protein
VIIWWCDLHLHMSCITEIQGAVVVVIIWWCDLQLHMSCITEIQGAVVVSHHHMITTTTTPCISVIHDICSCKSHHHMITTTTASCISVIHDICSCKSIICWCDLQLHMSCITEIQEAFVVVIIWRCDLQLHNHDHDGLLYFSNT